MKTIALISQKGGSGKTTLAVNLAVQAHRAGLRTTIVDIDSQQTATKWHDRRSGAPPPVISAQAERLPVVLGSLSDLDLIVIDTAGKADREALIAARAADLILIPTRPAIEDIEAIPRTLDIVRMATKPVYAVFNAALSHHDSRITQGTGLIMDMGLDCAPAVICQRVILADSKIVGQAAVELDPRCKAACEVERLYGWVLNKLQLRAYA
jgi:chromosome partitioning protein